MRCYSINIMYLAGIHAGIQSGHAQCEIALKYLINRANEQGPEAVAGLAEWLENHKTAVILNGGQFGDLLKVEKFLGQPANHRYAWAPFRESEYSLNNTLTSIALVLPEHMYKYSREIVAMESAISNPQINFVTAKDGGQFECGKGSLKLTARNADGDGWGEVFHYDTFDLELIRLLAPMPLMN